MNAESDTIVVAQPTNRVSPARLGREENAGMALFPPGQLPSTQIPADWGQNDATKPDYIKNKPEIPSKPSDIDAAAAQHTHAQTDVTGLAAALAGKAASQHSHAQSDVTGLANALAAKAAAQHSHAQADVTGLADALAGKAASQHSHAQSDVTGLANALAAKAAASHTHTQTDVTGLADALADKLDATKRNLLDYTSGTTLAPETAVCRSSLNADGTFPTITDTAIPAAAAYYQFELELTVPSTVPSTITGPSGWTFLDGHGLPDPADLTGGETIYISCRMDCGATGKPVLASVWRVS